MPWRKMIAVSTAIMIGLFLYKVLYHIPGTEYLHLIIDYHFGFAKRAFIGTLVSFVLPVVPVWLVYALGGAMWLLASLFHAAAAAHPHIERTFAAMGAVGVVETNDQGAEFRQPQPKRDLPFQHAAFRAARAFAGNDHHQPRITRLRGLQKTQQ